MDRREFFRASAAVAVPRLAFAPDSNDQMYTGELVRCVATVTYLPVTEMWVTREQLPFVPVQYINEVDCPWMRDMR